MRLTTKSEYAILALIFLARKEGQGFVKIEEICTCYDIPKKYLEFLFMALKQNRYIRTRRGSAGGYALARPASEISMAEIVRLMDGGPGSDRVGQYLFLFGYTPDSGTQGH